MRLSKLEKYHAMLEAEGFSGMYSRRLEPGSGYEYCSQGEIMQDEQDGGLAGYVASKMREALVADLAEESALKTEYEAWLGGMTPADRSALDERLIFYRVADQYEPDPKPFVRPAGVNEQGLLTLDPPVEVTAAQDFVLGTPWSEESVEIKAGEKLLITGVPGGYNDNDGFIEGEAKGFKGGWVGPHDIVEYDRVWDMHPWNLRCPKGHKAHLAGAFDDGVEGYKCDGGCKENFTHQRPDDPTCKTLVPLCFTCHNKGFSFYDDGCPDCDPPRKAVKLPPMPAAELPPRKPAAPTPHDDTDIPF